MMNTPALSRSRMYLLQYVPPCTRSPIDTISSRPSDTQLFTNTPGSRLTTCAFRIDVFCCTVGSVGSCLTRRQLYCCIIIKLPTYLPTYLNACRVKHETLLHPYVRHTVMRFEALILVFVILFFSRTKPKAHEAATDRLDR
jgi:hypothetical protein